MSLWLGKMIFATSSGHFLCDSFACWNCGRDIFGTELAFRGLSNDSVCCKLTGAGACVEWLTC